MGSKGKTARTPTQEELNKIQTRRENIRNRLENISPTMLDFRNHELRLRAIEQQLGIPSPPLRNLKRRLTVRGDDGYA